MRMKFRKHMAETGCGGQCGHRLWRRQKPSNRDVEALLAIWARHPATARPSAWKMARAFISDTPDPALVDAT